MSSDKHQGYKPTEKSNAPPVQQNYLVRLMALDGDKNKADMNPPLKIRGAYNKFEAIERFQIANGIIRTSDEYEVTELGDGSGPDAVGHFSKIQWDDALESSTGPNASQKLVTY